MTKPYKLDISQFGEKVRDNMKFTITNVSEQDVTLEFIAGLEGIGELTLPSSIAAGQSASGVVTLFAESLEKSFEKSFTFQVNDETNSRFTIPVTRSIKSPTATTPAAAGK